jgi:hypothetical protein
MEQTEAVMRARRGRRPRRRQASCRSFFIESVGDIQGERESERERGAREPTFSMPSSVAVPFEK